MGWFAVAAAILLLAIGGFVLSFLSEPSAVGRMRVALYVIGAGSTIAGLAAGGAGLWILIRRRT